MKVVTEVNKCRECPYFGDRYEFGCYTSYCQHPSADSHIDRDSAYMHVGTDRIPRDTISSRCPLRR